METRYVIKVLLNRKGEWIQVVSPDSSIYGHKYMSIAAMEMIQLQDQFPDNLYQIFLTN